VIADLEHTLDAQLFDRRPRGVELTLYGKALLTRTRAVFDELRQGVNDIAILADRRSESCGSAVRRLLWRRSCSSLSRIFGNPSKSGPAGQRSPIALVFGLRERTHDLHLEWCVPPFSRDEWETCECRVLFDDHLVVVAGCNPDGLAVARSISPASRRAMDNRTSNTANYGSHRRSVSRDRPRHAKGRLETTRCRCETHFLLTGRFIGRCRGRLLPDCR